MQEQEIVAADVAAVETETTTPSISETETTIATDTSEVGTLDQPGDEGNEPPRAQKRIQELIREKKMLEEKAAYWDALNAQMPAPAEEDEEGAITVDSIAEAVLRRQKAEQIERARMDAQSAMQRDALEALQAHPELETDNDLADMVVAYAEKNKLSFKAAADRVKSKMLQEQKKAAAKVLADQASRAGTSTPSSGRVTTSGAMPPPNLSAMSEEEKRANWDQIISSYRR